MPRADIAERARLLEGMQVRARIVPTAEEWQDYAYELLAHLQAEQLRAGRTLQLVTAILAALGPGGPLSVGAAGVAKLAEHLAALGVADTDALLFGPRPVRRPR